MHCSSSFIFSETQKLKKLKKLKKMKKLIISTPTSITSEEGDESVIEEKREELANHALIRGVNVLESSNEYSLCVSRVANGTYLDRSSFSR